MKLSSRCLLTLAVSITLFSTTIGVDENNKLALERHKVEVFESGDSCLPGHFWSGDSCSPCPRNTHSPQYSKKEESNVCIPCPEGLATDGEGNAHCTIPFEEVHGDDFEIPIENILYSTLLTGAGVASGMFCCFPSKSKRRDKEDYPEQSGENKDWGVVNNAHAQKIKSAAFTSSPSSPASPMPMQGINTPFGSVPNPNWVAGGMEVPNGSGSGSGPRSPQKRNQDFSPIDMARSRRNDNILSISTGNLSYNPNGNGSPMMRSLSMGRLNGESQQSPAGNAKSMTALTQALFLLENCVRDITQNRLNLTAEIEEAKTQLQAAALMAVKGVQESLATIESILPDICRSPPPPHLVLEFGTNCTMITALYRQAVFISGPAEHNFHDAIVSLCHQSVALLTYQKQSLANTASSTDLSDKLSPKVERLQQSVRGALNQISQAILLFPDFNHVRTDINALFNLQSELESAVAQFAMKPFTPEPSTSFLVYGNRVHVTAVKQLIPEIKQFSQMDNVALEGVITTTLRMGRLAMTILKASEGLYFFTDSDESKERVRQCVEDSMTAVLALFECVVYIQQRKDYNPKNVVRAMRKPLKKVHYDIVKYCRLINEHMTPLSSCKNLVKQMELMIPVLESMIKFALDGNLDPLDHSTNFSQYKEIMIQHMRKMEPLVETITLIMRNAPNKPEDVELQLSTHLSDLFAAYNDFKDLLKPACCALTSSENMAQVKVLEHGLSLAKSTHAFFMLVYTGVRRVGAPTDEKADKQSQFEVLWHHRVAKQRSHITKLLDLLEKVSKDARSRAMTCADMAVKAIDASLKLTSSVSDGLDYDSPETTLELSEQITDAVKKILELSPQVGNDALIQDTVFMTIRKLRTVFEGWLAGTKRTMSIMEKQGLSVQEMRNLIIEMATSVKTVLENTKNMLIETSDIAKIKSRDMLQGGDNKGLVVKVPTVNFAEKRRQSVQDISQCFEKTRILSARVVKFAPARIADERYGQSGEEESSGIQELVQATRQLERSALQARPGILRKETNSTPNSPMTPRPKETKPDNKPDLSNLLKTLHPQLQDSANMLIEATIVLFRATLRAQKEVSHVGTASHENTASDGFVSVAKSIAMHVREFCSAANDTIRRDPTNAGYDAQLVGATDALTRKVTQIMTICSTPQVGQSLSSETMSKLKSTVQSVLTALTTVANTARQKGESKTGEVGEVYDDDDWEDGRMNELQQILNDKGQASAHYASHPEFDNMEMHFNKAKEKLNSLRKSSAFRN